MCIRDSYNVIWKTGWGAERLKPKPPTPHKYPPCNPNSGLLSDRMIVLRRRLCIGVNAAAKKADICNTTRDDIEKELTNRKPATVAKIERLLEEYQIPVSTAPHTPVR